MLLLTVVLSCFLPLYLGFDISSCIKYESYLTNQYVMAPLKFSDIWFGESTRYAPKIVTKINYRTRRIVGCCEAGYKYKGYPSFHCQPICAAGCPLNAFCLQPNQCTCIIGYYKSIDGLTCLSYDALTTTKTTTELITETTSPKVPCNGSCSSTEMCSLLDDVCICKDGYQRLNNGTGCVPKCDSGCQNADCTSPNICTCWPHYEPTNDTSCHLKCTELSCTFGTCNSNGNCICAEGFFNNGTNCIWAADDIFSEPDDCECWSKFAWQTSNVTESRCINSCDDADNNNSSKELTSDCIPVSDCEFYEGYTICHTQMYKCIDMPTPSPPPPPTSVSLSTTTVIPSMMADKVTKNINNTSTEMPFLLVGSLALIIIAGLSLLVWKIRRTQFNQLWSYNNMGTSHQGEQI